MRTPDECRLSGRKAAHAASETAGSTGRARLRLNCARTMMVSCLDQQCDHTLLTAVPGGRLRATGKQIPKDVVMARLFSASGMPHRRDYRRRAAPHRADGAEEPTSLTGPNEADESMSERAVGRPDRWPNLANYGDAGRGRARIWVQDVSGSCNRSTGPYD
jgi:hypothetical protein